MTTEQWAEYLSTKHWDNLDELAKIITDLIGDY